MREVGWYPNCLLLLDRNLIFEKRHWLSFGVLVYVGFGYNNQQGWECIMPLFGWFSEGVSSVKGWHNQQRLWQVVLFHWVNASNKLIQKLVLRTLYPRCHSFVQQNWAVPMDIGWSRAGYCQGRGGRGRGRGGFQSNATNIEGQTSNACFNCGAIEHFAHNCPNKRNQSARTATTDDDETVANEETTDCVTWIKTELASLLQEETTHLADKLEPSQDFPNAWLNRH